MKSVVIEASWREALSEEFKKEYWTNLTDFVRKEYLTKTVYPPPKNIFRAYDLCPLDEVKVVIVGQDPYHGEGQANGLCFAVNEGVDLPPSLKNIFKEIGSDLKIWPLPSGDLSRWSEQGVFMINSVLTVAAGVPTSHSKKGWEIFTDATIKVLNEKRKNIVYMLWGKYAQEKGRVIDRDNNLVLESGHPSPFSANLFFGHHHFSRCNAYLEEYGKKKIDWK
ncbi:uracil-DNA glycosylase [Patescibacteria group bacterium]|nr:uracil-DNA glycosylase [Patescibacteria group bacterium]